MSNSKVEQLEVEYHELLKLLENRETRNKQIAARFMEVTNELEALGAF